MVSVWVQHNSKSKLIIKLKQYIVDDVLKYKTRKPNNILLLYILWIVRHYEECHLELYGIDEKCEVWFSG